MTFNNGRYCTWCCEEPVGDIFFMKRILSQDLKKNQKLDSHNILKSRVEINACHWLSFCLSPHGIDVEWNLLLWVSIFQTLKSNF